MKFQDAVNHSVNQFDSTEFIESIQDEDPTMLKSLSLLKEINKLGFITLESQAGDKKDTMYEKGYIIGFMLQNNAEKFINCFNLCTDKAGVFVAKCNNEVIIPSKLDIPLTFSLKSNKVLTHTSTVLPESVWEMYREEKHIDKSEDIVLVLCWDTHWNRHALQSTGLFTQVRDVLYDISKNNSCCIPSN